MYDLQKARRADPGVRTRASWLSVFPIREMIRRGWIEDAEPALLDLQMMRFFGKNRIEDIPFIGSGTVPAYAAKKSTYESTTPIQYAWLHRVRKIAEGTECPTYSRQALLDSLIRIRAHMLVKEDFAGIPGILWKCGVRFMLVEALPGSKIDGVCLWLDDQPVIGMTLRLDRPDNVCFVIRHEIEHVLREDGREMSYAPVDELDNEPTDECERVANQAAEEFCVPRALLESFIARKSPFISERDVLSFAARVEVHPSIVIGQIQNRTKNYAWLRKYQTSIREYLLRWKYKDGWGFQAPTGL
jgi:HTH-type transcriptional regulator / antitoxin HigA